jgi:hypothetical protein
MTQLVVSEQVSRIGIRHPLACLVRKYGRPGDICDLAAKIRSLEEAVLRVGNSRRVPILVQHGGSISDDLWIDIHTTALDLSDNTSNAVATDQFVILQAMSDASTMMESSDRFKPVPPLSADATTAIFVIVGNARGSATENRGHALEVMREFKRTCPMAYGQFIPTVLAGKTRVLEHG